MKLSALGRQGPFGLLGPGFSPHTPGDWVLLDALRETSDPSANLFFAPYESTGREARCFNSDITHLGMLSLDVSCLPVPAALDAVGHATAVETIRAAIAAGDVYQVNHTVRAVLPPVDGAALVASLCRRGVPRFLAWVRLPDGTEFVSASPELLFAIDGDRIRVEPMKGTAPAGQSAALTASAKDDAELAMITDLLRNDLTPLCVPRSVTVTEPRRILELPYAVQAVSEVVGTLLPGIGWRAALDGLHPGGSITGAPRRAAMAMIAALERSPRGPYCGALGYIRDATTVASLLIRTATRTPVGWTYGVGGGIVWDSSAEGELAEVYVKLGALG